jgi:hypothetical protein
MSCHQVDILNYNHSIVALSEGNTLVITDNNTCNSVVIPQPVTCILQVNSPGPQGAMPNPIGPDGAIQFKSGSEFSGEQGLKYDYTKGNVIISGSSDFLLQIHSKDGGPWSFGMYNDIFNPTQAVLAGFIWDNGKSSIGTEVDTPLEIYTNANYGSPTLTISSSGVTINNTLQQGFNIIASGSYSHAEGQNTLASGYASHAEGYGTIASGSYSHAEGVGTIVVDQGSHAEGENTIASGSYSHAEGSATIAVGYSSHAEGISTIAIGNWSHTEGVGTIAYGNWSHAEGDYTIASGSYSHAEGESTIASGSYSHAEGESTISYGVGSHAEGLGTIALGNYQHTQGQYNIPSPNQSAFIIGNGVDDTNRSNLIYASDSQVQITGSVSISSVLNLAKSHPLPTGITGSLAVSGSHLYFHNGTSWVQTI